MISHTWDLETGRLPVILTSNLTVQFMREQYNKLGPPEFLRQYNRQRPSLLFDLETWDVMYGLFHLLGTGTTPACSIRARAPGQLCALQP